MHQRTGLPTSIPVIVHRWLIAPSSPQPALANHDKIKKALENLILPIYLQHIALSMPSRHIRQYVPLLGKLMWQ
jgi:hypothetical protein